MKSKISFCLAGLLLLCISINSSAQNNTTHGYDIEQVDSLWNLTLTKVLNNYNASEKDAETYSRFDETTLSDLKVDFFRKMGKVRFESARTEKIVNEAELSISSLYAKFLFIKENYPSSVAEFSQKSRITSSLPCDTSGCSNIDFSSGNLSGWYGYYANRDNVCATITISGATGGALGAVTEGCNDPTTAAYNALTVDYQISLTSGGYDALVPTIPRVCPFNASGHSVMLGDSTYVGYGVAILEKTFKVTASNPGITYQYAPFLENPVHCYGNQPFFEVAFLDSLGDTIPNCGQYLLTSGFGIKGFDSTTYGGSIVYYKDWSSVCVPLSRYIGQCVTIIFEVSDCGQGGHFGYAYVDASCSPLEIFSSSPNLCGQDSICLTAPPGFVKYFWWDSVSGNAIRGSDTSQTICVDSAGTYYVILTPATGATCGDTISITISKSPGPLPHPSFITSPTCSGEPMYFSNNSNPLSGATFDWDFYNMDYYNDTNVTNPTWTYITPGIYSVRLHEVYNGCGNDTVEKVTVDTTVNGSFSAPNVCIGSSTNFTYTGTGATSWSWNFGDPSTLADTSNAQNTSYTYTMTGTYTVTLISSNGRCPDTLKQVVKVDSMPVISGLDTICVGYNDTLTVTGGSSYVWINGATTSTLVVSPTTTKTITVTADGACAASFTVTPVSAPTPIITATFDSICAGVSDTLYAHGGTSYRWSTGQTTTSIVVNPLTSTTYNLTAYIGSSSCFDSAKITIAVTPLPSPHITGKDTVCKGSADTLFVTGGTLYLWSNGSSNTSLIINPVNKDTLITVEAFNNMLCFVYDSVLIKVDSCLLGINNIQSAYQFSVFPNPSNGVVTVQMTGFNEPWSVKVYDVLGQEVYSQLNINNSQSNIDLSSKADGVYFYRLLKEDGSLVGNGKFVIER